MTIFKKYRLEIIVGLLLTFIFFFTRLINLTQMPIFTDEAIYLRWAQIAKNDAAWRFISLTDGKQPLFVWLAMISMKFISDPVLAGRLVSTIAGFLTMVGMGLLGRELFKSRRAGLISATLYLVLPFSLVYDRMALMDTMVGMFAVWSFFFACLLVKKVRLDLALIFGWILGGGVLTKTSGFFNIYLLPSIFLLFPWDRKNRSLNLIRAIGLFILAVAVSQIIYSVLRLSPWFHMLSQKDATFIYPFREWINHPFNFLLGNLNGLFNWLSTYLTWPLLLSALGGLLLALKHPRERIVLFIWFFVPFFALALFGKVLYPRFILFMTLPLLILAASFLDYLATVFKIRAFFISLLAIILVYPLFFDLQILINLYHAPIPESDRGQYLNNWPAGGGVKEAVVFFRDQAQNNKIAIFTDGTFGLMPYSLELYLVDNPNIKIKGIWPLEKITDEIINSAREKPTFLITNEFQEIPKDWPLRLLQQYPKGESQVFLRIFAVNPPQTISSRSQK